MKISGRFGVIPAAWLEQEAVGLDEIGVLACLATFADSQGCCFPSQGTIAARLKRSRPWVIKIIHRLVALGLVERIHRYQDNGAQRACLYRLCYPSTADAAESPRDDRESHPPDNPCPREDSEQDSFQHITLSSSKERDQVCNPDLQNQTRSSEPALSIVSSNWHPSPADQTWAAQAYPDADLQRFTEQFIHACQAHGYRYRDHSSAWRSWLADWSQRRKPSRNGMRFPQAAASAIQPLPALFRSGDLCHESLENRQSTVFNPAGSGGLIEHNRAIAAAARQRLQERRQRGSRHETPQPTATTG